MKYPCKECGIRFERSGHTNFLCIECRNKKNTELGMRRKGVTNKTILQRMIEEIEEQEEGEKI